MSFRVPDWGLGPRFPTKMFLRMNDRRHVALGKVLFLHKEEFYGFQESAVVISTFLALVQVQV
jgi:hypothetical protein